MGRRRIKVTVCNVPIQLSGDILAAFLSDYEDVEDYTIMKSTSGTAHGDYTFTMCLNSGGFQAIPHTVEYKDQAMLVVVEGRKPQCCKQIGHFSQSCPQKPTTSAAQTAATTSLAQTRVNISPSKTTSSPATTIPNTANIPQTETGDNPNNKEEEEWTQVMRGKKSLPKAPKSPTAKTTDIKNTESEKRKLKKQRKRKKKPTQKQ